MSKEEVGPLLFQADSSHDVASQELDDLASQQYRGVKPGGAISLDIQGGNVGELEGDIATGRRRNVVEGELNTLDEPIADTIKRDLSAVWSKIWNALMPMKNPKFLLVEWDLWGALFFATFIGICLQQMNSYDNGSQFTQIIVIVCLGTAAVTYTHVVMLRTSTSIFQYVSVLGYCLAPMALYVMTMYLFDFLIGIPFWIRFLFFVAATAWSVYAASLILKPDEGPINIPYHLFPIGLYYITVGTLILYHTHSNSSSTVWVPVSVLQSTGA